MGLARLMHLDSADALARRRIELIESSGRHLFGLISDLLDMAVMEEGRFALREEVFDQCAQLNQVMGVYEVRAQEKGLRLDVDCGLSSPLWVRGDPVRFRQVLHNLLGNAVKFTAQGHVALRMRPAEDDGEGCCFRFVARLPRVAEAASAAQVPADSLAGQRLQVLLAEDDDVNAMIAEAMDGYEATREIRRREAALGLPRLHIVALTATVTAPSRAQCMEAGMDDFLSKPFTLDDLARVLQRPLPVAEAGG